MRVAASSGARRRAKVRQSGEVDPGGEDAPPRTARAAIFRECAGKSEPVRSFTYPRSLGILEKRHAPATFLLANRQIITKSLTNHDRLADGRKLKGFLVEAAATQGARDISAFGGWRAFMAQARASA